MTFLESLFIQATLVVLAIGAIRVFVEAAALVVR